MNAIEPIIPESPSLIDSMPATQYHAVEALSASGAKKILRSPAHYKLERDQPSEPTPAMRFGSAVHAAVLEPESFEAEVMRSPKFDRRTKEGKAAAEEFEAQAVGRLVLSGDDFDRCLRVRDAVLAHPAAQRLLSGTVRELSLFWTDAKFDVPCKGRFDAYGRDSHRGLVDLKTTQDASPDAFGRTIANFLYHLQAAFYFSGAEHVIGKTPAFFAFIAVETEPPHAVACYVLDNAHLLAGARLAEEALSRYQQALQSGIWPGYGDLILPARLPAWALKFDNL